MTKKIFSIILSAALVCVFFITGKEAHAMQEGFTATELLSNQTITVDGVKDSSWDYASPFNLDNVRKTHLYNESLNNSNPATGKVSVMYNANKLYLFAEILDSTRDLNKLSTWNPFSGEYNSYQFMTDHLSVFLDIKHNDPSNASLAWGSDYNGGKAVAAHFELAAGAGELKYSEDGTLGWAYNTANEKYTLSEYAKTHSTIYSLTTETGYTFEMEIDLSEAGVTDFSVGKDIGLNVAYYDRFDSCGGDWGEQSVTSTAFLYGNEDTGYNPEGGPAWLPEVTFIKKAIGVSNNLTATKTDKVIGVADGVKDDAYSDAKQIQISHVAWENENSSPATANMYLLWDSSFLYVFVEVIDDTHYGYQEGTWLELRDALEMIVDLYHNTSYTGGYGGDYRGTKMCEGYYKIAAGVGVASVGSTVQGTHWMWDDGATRDAGSFASALTETGYTVEYKIGLGKDANIYMIAEREIGIGVKIYDKHANDKDGSITVLEGKNDAQHEKPGNLSSIKLVDINNAKAEAKAELAGYKSADLYRDAEQAQLKAVLEASNTAIDAATSYEQIKSFVTSAKTEIDAIKTKAQYEAEEAEIALALANAKTEAKAELAGYKSADLYREAEQAQLRAILEAANATIDSVATKEAIAPILVQVKAEIDALKTDAQYDEEEALGLANAKETAKAELAGYKSADLYREAEQAQLSAIITAANATIDAALTFDEIHGLVAGAKAEIDKLKTAEQYRVEELANAKTEAKAELAEYKSADLYREAEQAQLAKAIEDGNAAIEAATTTDAVATALSDAKLVIDAIKTKAEYEAEEAQLLADAKVAAKAELAEYKSADLYREAEQSQLAKAIEDGNTAIEAATTTDAVATVLADAKAVIDGLKTKAEYEAEEAAKALADAKAAAKAELEGYKSVDDYRTDEGAKYLETIDNAKNAIEAATTTDAVASALADAKATIDGLKTKAEYEAEEAAKALADAKVAAKAELESYKSLEGLTEEQKAEVSDKVTEGKAAIDAATTTDTVASALASAKKALDAITPANKVVTVGCAGSIAATFFGMFVLAASAVVLRKKKESNR